ncbi:MAG TPA: hypothetical protein VJP79_07070 [Nitrososphaera sp.]|nr:hypothetical protein [Nitrososphaera sp.]
MFDSEGRDRSRIRSPFSLIYHDMGLAATVLYMSCLANGENKTQKDIADAAGVTEVTIRNRFKDLKSKLGFNRFGELLSR